VPFNAPEQLRAQNASTEQLPISKMRKYCCEVYCSEVCLQYSIG